MNDELDQLAINTIRMLSIDAIQKAKSGHPGTPLDAAPTAYVLWQRFLRYDPAAPNWLNRDRFVLSAGHASMLLYALIHLTGVKVEGPLNTGRDAVTCMTSRRSGRRAAAARVIRSMAGPRGSKRRRDRSVRGQQQVSEWP
jgi:transketolase N-terminal domain/subunit